MARSGKGGRALALGRERPMAAERSSARREPVADQARRFAFGCALLGGAGVLVWERSVR